VTTASVRWVSDSGRFLALGVLGVGMNRRRVLGSVVAGGSVAVSGCVGWFGLGGGVSAGSVFERVAFEGESVVVGFRSGVDVERVSLVDSSTGVTLTSVERPGRTARLQTFVGRSLHVRAATSDGTVEEWLPGHVHARVRDVAVLSDGRVRFGIENQGDAPLLVRFVAVHGDVPNPALDPQAEGFERSALPFGPGVVGVGENQPGDASREDLVVTAGERAAYETTYAPFAGDDDATAGGTNDATEDGTEDERRASITVVHGSGGSASYDIS
jgi:hypothetical protein